MKTWIKAQYAKAIADPVVTSAADQIEALNREVEKLRQEAIVRDRRIEAIEVYIGKRSDIEPC